MMKTRLAGRLAVGLLLPGVALAQGTFPPEKAELLELKARLDPGDSEIGTEYGRSLAIGGNLVFVGAPFDDDSSAWWGAETENVGCAYAFTNVGGSWQRVAKWTAAPQEGIEFRLLFGWSIAASPTYVVVGAPHQREYGGLPGYAYVYLNRLSSLTTFHGSRLSAGSGAGPGSQFGYAVAIADEAAGYTIVVGAIQANGRNNLGEGAAYVFAKNATTGWQWQETQRIYGSQDDQSDDFGAAIALDGTNLVVGAPSLGLRSPGRVYVFERQASGLYAQRHVLTTTWASDFQDFGAAVAIQGSTLVVGGGKGKAYVFRRYAEGWRESGMPLSSDASHGDFGASVAMSGDSVVVGAPSSGGGSVHLFTWDGAAWAEEPGKAGQYSSSHPGYGGAVAVSRDIIAAAGANDYYHNQAPSAGAVFGIGYSNDTTVANHVAKYLYVSPAAAAQRLFFDPWQAAFRYQHFLFSKDAASSLRAQYQHLSEYYGAAEQARAAAAELELWAGFSANPTSGVLGGLLLDLYYDRAVAESVFLEDTLADAALTRYGLKNVVTNGFVIDPEVGAYDQALTRLESVLAGYFQLFRHPEGCRAFKELVPTRALMPLMCVETNAAGAITNTFPVTGDTQPLFPGYKDLVLVYRLLEDYGQIATELARLRHTRGEQPAAQELIARTQRRLALQSALLRGLFPALSLPPDDPSGLAQAMAGVNTALEALEQLKQSVRGSVNLLGFEDDFLLLARVEDSEDSFDALRGYLDPQVPGSQPLAGALGELADVREHYADFREYEDDLAEQFADSSITYSDRLRDIVGVFPDDLNYTDNPTANPGSELDQQFRDIQLARLRILRNRTEIDNLRAEVEIEARRALAVSNVVIDFGDRRADISETIGHINAGQAGCDALANAFSFENPGAALFGMFNAAAQAYAEERKGQLEAEKERLAALEQATVVGIENAAKIKTLLLNMRTLLIDSQEAALEMKQEVHRLQALYREKRSLERKLAQRDVRLSRRYFADPIHRVRVQAGMIRADHTFAEAQKWLFFMTRALGYKWNKPSWSRVHLGRTWDAASVFKLRNAGELYDLHQAMQNYDAEPDFSYQSNSLHDWFSVREDFFGYKLTNQAGVLLLYLDPETGNQLDAIAAFRRQLYKLETNDLIRLTFSTVREIPGGDFFKGPQYDASGQLWMKGYWLDKIDWVRINLIGAHTSGYPKVTGSLSYGGTSFIRNFRMGNRTNRLDRLQNEMTAYSTRYWYYDIDHGRWASEGPQSTPITMQLRFDPRVPSNFYENRQFRERSVAATRWELVIPLSEANQPVLDIGELDDIEIEFQHHAVPRP